MVTMKPWEETWEVRNGSDVHHVTDPPHIRPLAAFLPDPEDAETDHESRARLAAAAPDLVREMLKCDAVMHVCNACGARGEWEDGNRYRLLTHAERCMWTAALRKAGVR
jgi:hypothetical protein